MLALRQGYTTTRLIGLLIVLRARKVRAYGKNTPHKKLAARHRCRSLVSGTPSQEKSTLPAKPNFSTQQEQGNDRQMRLFPCFFAKNGLIPRMYDDFHILTSLLQIKLVKICCSCYSLSKPEKEILYTGKGKIILEYIQTGKKQQNFYHQLYNQLIQHNKNYIKTNIFLY